ncbi:type VI secretion protein [Streptomyces sparsus]
MPHDLPPAARPTGPGPRGGGVPDSLLVGGLALLLSLTLLTWTAAGLAGLFSHGSWPSGLGFTRTPLALRALVTEPGDLAAAWPSAEAATLPRPGLFWGVLISQLLVLGTVTLAVAVSVSRRRALRKAARADAHRTPDPRSAPLPGSPAAHEVPAPTAAPLTEQSVHPHNGRPGVPTEPLDRQASEPHVGQAGEPSGPEPAAPSGQRPEPLRAPQPPAFPLPAHDEAPDPHPGLRLRHAADPAEALRAAEGPALVVTADVSLWRETVGARSKLGPTYLYDPGHLTEAPVRLSWSPEHGCADPATARSRAAALLTPVRSPARADETTHAAAETILRCCLHAVAVSGRPFRQVHRWTATGAVGDAVRILRKDRGAAAGTAGELEAMLIAHPERRDQAMELIRRALASLSQLHVRNACTASRIDTAARESFLQEMGTLYLMGESVEVPRRAPGTMPLLTALTENVVEHGRRVAERSSAGRLDPPLTLILDGPATVAPLAGLPALLSHGAENGLRVFAYLRSMDQAHAWWPQLGASHSGRSSSIR